MTEAHHRLQLRLRALCVPVALLLLAVLVVPASAQNPEEARVSATRARLAEIREELEDAEGEAREDQLALEEADARVREVLDAVATAEQAVQRQRGAVDLAREELEVRRQELAAQQERMGERIARLYRQRPPDPVLSFLDASTLSTAVLQSTYMTAIGRTDRAAFEELANAATAVQAQQEALAEEEAVLARVLADQEALLADVEAIRNDRELLAAASADLVARLQAEEAHLEEESRQLAALARAAEEEAAAAEAAAARSAGEEDGGGDGQPLVGPATVAGSPESRPQDQAGAPDAGDGDGEPAAPAPAPAPPPPSGGGFSWPTSGPITSEFGPRWGRMHEGIDIGGSTGQAIAAARGGSVVHAGSMSGYGNLVLIAHGDGFTTAYAHLDSISVSAGQRVSTGTHVGGMGCTGSCTGTHLHFEIRVNGTPQNPLGYL